MQCVPVVVRTVQPVHRAGSLHTHGGAAHGAVLCSTQGRGREQGWAVGAWGCAGLQTLSCVPPRAGSMCGRALPCPAASCGVGELAVPAAATATEYELPTTHSCGDASRTHASLGLVLFGSGQGKRVQYPTSQPVSPVGPWKEGILGARDGPSVS